MAESLHAAQLRAHVEHRKVAGEDAVAGFLQWMHDHYVQVQNVTILPVGAVPAGRVQKANGPTPGMIVYIVFAVGRGRIPEIV